MPSKTRSNLKYSSTKVTSQINLNSLTFLIHQLSRVTKNFYKNFKNTQSGTMTTKKE